MTITDMRPAQATAPMMAVTLPARPFVTALRNVAPFASTDTTLPAICGVLMELAEDGTITLVSTDRYVLATQVLEPEQTNRSEGMAPGNPPCSGSGKVFLTAATVKALGAVKATYGQLITLTVSPEGALTVGLPDTSVATYPASGCEFPTWRRLVADFTPCAEGDTPGTVTYNPAFLAKFAKIKDGACGVSLTPGRQSGKTDGPAVISRAVCGEVTAWIMHIRKS